MIDLPKLHQDLDRLRRSRGWSWGHLAKKTGVPSPSMKAPSPDQLTVLIMFLGNPASTYRKDVS